MKSINIPNNFVFKDFTNCTPVQKTLRFKLIPQGKTLENIKNSGFLERDEKRYQDSKIVQGFIDDLCREFIDNALEAVHIDNWEKLEELVNKGASKKNKGNEKLKKKINKEKRNLRSSIQKRFEDFSKEKYELKEGSKNSNLFDEINKGKTTFVTNLLPQWMVKHGYEEEDIQLAMKFKGFTGYFNTFMQNRQNMFTDDGKASSIFTRAVDDNFIRFLNNKKKIQRVENSGASLIELEAFDDDLLDANSYNSFISPNGIKDYNKKISKINKELNELKPKNETKNKVKLEKLWKQILCEGESSFRIEKIENDGELSSALDLVCELWFKVEKSKEEDISSIVNSAKETVALIESCYDDIEIEPKRVDNLSKVLFDNRNSFFINEEERKRKKTVALHELIENYNSASDENHDIQSIVKKLNDKLDGLNKEINKRRLPVEGIANEYLGSEGKELIEDDGKIEIIKDLFDELKKYESIIRVFENKTDNVDGIDFYIELDSVLKKFKEFDKLYDQVRNYLTQKPYSMEKIPLRFDINELNACGARNKESSYRTLLFKGKGKYYLGIFGPGIATLSDKLKTTESSELEVAEFDRIKVRALVQNLMVIDGQTVKKNKKLDALKSKHLPREINEIRLKKTYLKDSENFKKEDAAKFIDYYIQRLIEYRGDVYHFKFKDPSEYEDYNDFINDASRYTYALNFEPVDRLKVMNCVSSGELLLFQIYNKDFASGASGSKNLHTLYWEEIFSLENQERAYTLELNARASLFYREMSIELPIVHKEGELLINKTYEVDGVWKSISDDDYVKAQEIARSKKSIKEVEEVLANEFADGDKFVVKKCKHDIIKDKRYTQDQFQFHVPITLNRCPKNKVINQYVLETIKIKRDEITFLGIDRGERHLLYLTLIDSKGNIKFQKSMNLIPCKRGDNTIDMDYQSMLDNKEKARDKARKSWKSIGNIKDLKQGYLSQVVHEISKIIVENNAVIVMEDLNFGFKRSRTKVEKQVYQKFEKQLIDKLSYLSFKPNTGIINDDIGSISKGLQLVPKFKTFNELGKQHGIIFYVDAWNTSHVDPSTGFMKLFRFPKNRKWNDFFNKFNFIRFNSKNNYFEFEFCYKNFETSCKDFINKWKICSYGTDRLYNKKNTNGHFETKTVNVTEEIKQLLDKNDIMYSDAKDIKNEIIQKIKQKDLNYFGWLFKQLCNLRYSKSNSDIDYILSPVADKNDIFYDSRNADIDEPSNADANGAYHIALKGLQLTDMIEKKKEKLEIKYPKNEEWVEWIQKFHNEV